MGRWLFTIDALDELDVATTLRFCDAGYDAGYIDAQANCYEPRIFSPALIKISPRDGGLFNIFDNSSVGDIELANQDGALDVLAGYALDGRPAVLSFLTDSGVPTVYFSGTVSGGIKGRSGAVVFSLKPQEELLADNHPMAVYAGTNVLPAGLEGSADDTDAIKPKALGYCKNIAAKLVNDSLLVHQASSRADCRIIAVYDEGVRLINFRVNGLHAINETVIAIDSGLGGIPTGAEIVFANHLTIYTVQSGAVAGGSLILDMGLVADVPDNSAIEHINFYASEADLQYTDYTVAADYLAGATAIALASGSGAIGSADKVMFSNHPVIYPVGTGLSGGGIVLSSGLSKDVPAGTFVHVVGASNPVLWGSFQGYFRIGLDPLGTVTCDTLSVDSSNGVHKVGDIFNIVANEAGVTMDAASITGLNTMGLAGLFVDSVASTRELLDRLIKSVAGYYHFSGDVLYADLLQAPAATAVFTIEDWQIKTITRVAIGMGKNQVPIKSILVHYDKLEAVQTAFAGFVPAYRRSRLKKQFLAKSDNDPTAAARYLLAGQLVVESLLRTGLSATQLINRLLPIISVRRDIVDIDAYLTQTPAFALGDTINIVTPRLDYGAGRMMVVLGRTVDTKKGLLSLRVYG